MKKPLLASFIFSTILVALSANAQDADASKPAQAYISDPNATYISADPNAPHYDLRDVPYEDRIRDAQSYQDLSDIRNEILRRDDLSKEEKLKLFDAISEETTRRIDVDHAVQTVSIWGKGITGILLETAGYSPMLIKTPLGGVLVAWGQGLINEDSAVDIMTKMGTSLLLDRLLGGAIKNAASQVAKNTGSKVEKFADNLIKNISKNPENCNIVRRIINKNTTTAIRQRLKEIKRTSDGKLSVAELAMKDFLKGEWISAMESFVYETTEWAVHYLANVIQNNMQNNGEDLIRERIERDADFAEVLYEYAMVLSMRNHGYEIDQEDLEGLRDRLIALGDDPITRTLLENVLRELENLTRPRPFNGLFPNKQEKLFNDIWEMGEEYSTPPPPCKCGETCACNGDRRAKWEKAYADFRKKQQLAYDRLNRDRSGPNPNLSDEVNEKNLTDYEENEEKDLIKAANDLADAYTAGCDCPESKVEPPPTPTLFTSNIPEFNEPDWREKHPIWAFILERVLPEFIRMIIDILLNHPELTIESLLKFDENGNPIIHDGVPEFNPDIEIDEIPTHPLPQTCEIPNEGTSDEDVFKDATEANRNAKDALLTPPECNCNESVVKLLELQNLIEQHKKAIEDFRLAHIAYAKSFDAIGDRLGDVFVDIGGNAVGALFGPHLKDIFCAATESLDIIGWATTGEYEISKLDLFWKVAEILVERFKEYYKKIEGDLPKEVVKLIGKELGERSIDIGLMFAKILVNIPITMYDVLTDWWDARNANDNAKEELAELTNRLNIEVSIYLANEGCYCKPGCMCKHCLVKRKIVITYPGDPDDPWHWVYGGNITTPNDILIGDGGGYENGGIIGGVPDLGSLIDGIGGGVLDSGGISIPDFGVSGSDSPIVPDSIGNPAIAITASGILNTASINSDNGKASVVVDGNKGGGASKRNIGDIGGQGQSQIWSNQK